VYLIDGMYDNPSRSSEVHCAPSRKHERARESEFTVRFIINYVGEFAYLLPKVAVSMCKSKFIRRSQVCTLIDNSNVKRI